MERAAPGVWRLYRELWRFAEGHRRQLVLSFALLIGSQLAKLAPREVLESPHGAAIRRAGEERAAVVGIVGKLPKPDRALIPDVEPTVKALVDRVAHLATALHSLELNIDLRALDEATLNLLTNREVIALNQTSRNNMPVSNDGQRVVWTAETANGSACYLALFNISDHPLVVEQKLKAIGAPRVTT